MEALPCETCGGQCCSHAPFNRREFKLVRKKYGIPKNAVVTDIGLGTVIAKLNGDCAFLSEHGRCTIYPDRPNICRLYGTIPELPCGKLHPEAAKKLVSAGLTRLKALAKEITDDASEGTERLAPKSRR